MDWLAAALTVNVLYGRLRQDDYEKWKRLCGNGLGAAIEFYRHGNINVPAAIILARTMFLGTWLGAVIANKILGSHLRLMFGIFVWGLGTYLIDGACRRLGWL